MRCFDIVINTKDIQTIPFPDLSLMKTSSATPPNPTLPKSPATLLTKPPANPGLSLKSLAVP